MFIVGVDPGANGAMAIIPIYRFTDAQVFRFDQNTLRDLCFLLCEKRAEPLSKSPYSDEETKYDEAMELWLENPAMIPGNGKISYRQLGERIGEWIGIAAALNMPTPERPTPMKWQNYLGCRTGGDKNVSKAFAQKIFPQLRNAKRVSTITNDSADALLIATYGYMQYVPQNRLPKILKENVPRKSWDVELKPRKPTREESTPIREVKAFVRKTLTREKKKKEEPNPYTE